MMKVAELLGHTERVLNTALSPDGSTLVSAGADETLRLVKYKIKTTCTLNSFQAAVLQYTFYSVSAG